MSDAPEWMDVCAVSEIPEDEGFCVKVQGKDVAVFHVEGKLHAIENSCPHRGGPMAEGRIEGGAVVCPWHAWRFNLSDGALSADPSICLKVFEAKLEGDRVFVK